jgi:hypothetical protein
MRKALMIANVLLLTLSGQFLVNSSASAAEFSDNFEPPPERVVIDVVSVNGSGCPPGTAQAVAADNTGFTVMYSQFMAVAGVGASPVDFRKNCQLGVLVHVPEGFTYAITRVDHEGFAALAAGANGVQRSSYYFQGRPNTRIVTHSFAGPLTDYWHTVDESDPASVEYHPCGALRILNINLELRVSAGSSAPTSTSFLAMDSTFGSVYDLVWKRCP